MKPKSNPCVYVIPFLSPRRPTLRAFPNSALFGSPPMFGPGPFKPTSTAVTLCHGFSRFIFAAAMKLFSNPSFTRDLPIPPLGIWNLELGVCQRARLAKSRLVSLNKCEGVPTVPQSASHLSSTSNQIQPNPTKRHAEPGWEFGV